MTPTLNLSSVPGDELPGLAGAEPLPVAPTSAAETFQHYQVLRREDGSLWELGRGAMGVTYKAFDTNLRCHVALKVISAQHLHSEMAGQRFVREARVAARLRHRNIASVYHLGVDPQSYFYSMEFIDGETLEDLVRRVGPLPLDLVLHIAHQVARALAAAALQGLIHRDLKPANIMVLHRDEEGEERLLVKVIDFGLARSYAADDSSPQLTATGFVGTPLYASPEQLEEQTLDVRSDIYSLGVTLWILLTGRPPFEGKMTMVITQHLHADPPWLKLGDCPEAARALLARMLAKQPADRFQSAGELRDAIEACWRQIGGQAAWMGDGVDAGDFGRGATTVSSLVKTEAAGLTASAAANSVAGMTPARPVVEAADGKVGGEAKFAGVKREVPLVSPQASAERTAAKGHAKRLPDWRWSLAGAAALVLATAGLVSLRGGSKTPGAPVAVPTERKTTPSSVEATTAATPAPKPVMASGGVDSQGEPTAAATVTAAAKAPSDSSELAGAADSGPAAVILAASATTSSEPEARGTNAEPVGTEAAFNPETRTLPDSTPANEAVTPTTPPTAQPVAAAAVDAADDDDTDDSTGTTAKGRGRTSAHSSHTHRHAKSAPTPAPNFFQKMFGIKPKPKTKTN